jgi:hypothetical protein
MRFNMPKPIHGWRALAGEIGIIVVGVLIALAAQQMAQDWQWQADARRAVEDLKKESQNNFLFAAERVVNQPCIEAQLDHLMDRVLASGSRFEPVDPISSSVGDQVLRQPTGRPWSSNIWDSIVADGVASHLDPEGRAAAAQMYTQFASLARRTEASDLAAARLTLLLSPIDLTADLKGHLAEIIAEERARSALIALDSTQNMATLWLLKQAPPAKDVDDLMRNSGTAQYCRDHHLPLGDWRKALAEATRGDDREMALLK